MESQRSFLFIALAFVSYLLFIEWQKDYAPLPETVEAQQSQQQTPASNIPVGDIAPANADIPQSSDGSQTITPQITEHLITVRTNVLEVKINTKGGDIVKAKLLDFPIEQNQPELIDLLSQYHVAQSGLIGANGPDGRKEGRPNYVANKLEFVTNGNEDVVVPLKWTNNQGIEVTKTFTFKADKYHIDLTYTVANNTSNIATIQPFAQLKKVIFAPESSMMLNAYNEATYSTLEERYEKYDLDDMRDKPLNKNTLGGWIAMQQHYFVAAWVPPAEQQNNIFSRVASDGAAIIGYKGPLTQIQPGDSNTISSTFYVGPKLQDELIALSESLELTVDYGPLWFISKGLFWLMNVFYSLIPNWGLAIILLTVVVKMVLYPLTYKQTVSMAKMRNLQPKLQQLKERYGDDRQKMGPAMMELYKKEKVNPVGGCLPLLMQMPIFLALYWMLMESVELRHADFILWITDLSSKDPYFVLPVLYGASMYLMQKMMPTPITDPMQQKMMQWMPVVFSIFFIIFPAGLVLYWLVNNLISILQTMYIHRKIDKQGLADTKAKKAK